MSIIQEIESNINTIDVTSYHHDSSALRSRPTRPNFSQVKKKHISSAVGLHTSFTQHKKNNFSFLERCYNYRNRYYLHPSWGRNTNQFYVCSFLPSFSPSSLPVQHLKNSSQQDSIMRPTRLFYLCQKCLRQFYWVSLRCLLIVSSVVIALMLFNLIMIHSSLAPQQASSKIFDSIHFNHKGKPPTYYADLNTRGYRSAMQRFVHCKYSLFRLLGGSCTQTTSLQTNNHLYKRTVFFSVTESHIPQNRGSKLSSNLLRPSPLDSYLLQDQGIRDSNHLVLDPMLRVSPSEEGPSQEGHLRGNFVEGDCVPMKEWHTQNYPTCNVVHECDLSTWGEIKHANLKQFQGHVRMVQRDDLVSILGKGWFRHTWKMTSGLLEEIVVVKTLRPEREFYDEYFELHRRDAVAMERLTSSPFILNIYSFCGQTAINEFADFIEGFHDFKTFARQLGGKNEPKILKLKLQIATMLTLAIMHIHEIDGPNNATMAHYDINPMNVAVTKGGIPKLNDFNVAHFFKFNHRLNTRCGFYGRFHEPWWRSPEEMVSPTNMTRQMPLSEQQLLDEKVDIYSLGNLIFLLLTGHSPRGRIDPNKIDEVRRLLMNGTAPVLNEFYANSTDTAIAALKNAMGMCYELNPKARSSAREIANGLLHTLDTMEEMKVEASLLV